MQVSTRPEPRILYSTAFTTTDTCLFLTVAGKLFTLRTKERPKELTGREPR